MTSDYTSLEKRLAYSFQDKELLSAALTHKSALKRFQKMRHSLERLEFLGDRVLGLAIAEKLYEKHLREKEGDIAKRLSVLVSKKSCAHIAKIIQLPHFIKAAKNDVTANSHIIPDALEALLGAIYLEGGFEKAKEVIHTLWNDLLEKDAIPPRDGKTALQEWAQATYKIIPTYKLLSQKGSDHAPVFCIQVSIENVGQEEAEGITKKEAEQKAALKLLTKLTS